MSIQDEMTSELWEKLAEIAAKKPEGFECVAFDIDERIPNWVSSLQSMGYLNYSVNGGGGRYKVFNLSEKGKQAVTAHKMSQG
jgi:hypothetical protein